MKQMAVISMKSGDKWHLAQYIGMEPGNEPNELPPADMLVYLVNGMEFPYDDNQLRFLPGLYMAKLQSWGFVDDRNKGEVGGEVEFKSYKNLVTKNNGPELGAALSINGFWCLIENKYIFVRSVTILHYEYIKHDLA